MGRFGLVGEHKVPSLVPGTKKGGGGEGSLRNNGSNIYAGAANLSRFKKSTTYANGYTHIYV